MAVNSMSTSSVLPSLEERTSLSDKSTVDFGGASIGSEENPYSQSMSLTSVSVSDKLSHLSTDMIGSSVVAGSLNMETSQFPMQMATVSVGDPSSDIRSSFSITSFSASADIKEIQTSGGNSVSPSLVTLASDLLTLIDSPSSDVMEIRSSPVSMEMTDTVSKSQSVTGAPQVLDSDSPTIPSDISVPVSMATEPALTPSEFDIAKSSEYLGVSETVNILATSNVDVKDSVSIFDLSDIYTGSQYPVLVSKTEGATSFVSPTPVVLPSTQISDSMKPVASVDLASDLSSDSLYPALPDNLQSTTDPSGEIYQSIKPTPSVMPSSTYLQPMYSSTMPPPIPSLRPTVSSGGENDTVVASTPTPGLGSSFPLVLGVSLCGAGVLIFLIILMVVCCRKRKTKTAKLEIQPQLQDLWVTSRSEIPMNPTLDTLPTLESVSESNEEKLSNGHSNFAKSPTDVTDETDYKVIYPFQVQEEGQLELNRGDIVIVSEKNDNGWWKGTIGDREGWFPGSYVKERKPPPVEKKPVIKRDDDTKTTDENIESTAPAPVSSFFLGRDSGKKLIAPLRKDSGRLYTPPKVEFRARGKEVTIPHLPNDDQVAEKRRSTVSPSKEHFEIEGTKFKVLFNYSPNFKEEISLQAGEIVTGIVKERNGWMTGRKDKTNEVGWFPAVYVERATQEEVEAFMAEEYGYPDKASVYNQLQVNKTPSSDKDWVGIEHIATCPYASESEHDLSFDIGDKILVFETLVNGWWFGSLGDEVGWFPGSYVEESNPRQMIEEEPEKEVKYKVSSEKLNITSPGANVPGTRLSVNSNISKLSVEKSDDEHSLCSVGTVDSKSGRRKPARKAPLPPKENGLSHRDNGKVPPTTPIRQTRQAPHPPGSGKMESTPDSKLGNNSVEISIDDGERMTEKSLDVSSISSKSADGTVTSTEKPKKPEIPKRYIKPKLIKVPRKKINLQAASTTNKAKKSPPPPRPDPPKNILRSPSSAHDNSTVDSGKDVDSSKGHSDMVTESDLSGVEAMNSINPSVSNGKNEGGPTGDRATRPQKSSISTPSKIPKFSKQSSVVNNHNSEEEENAYSVDDIGEELEKELSQNDRKHSTPKVKEGPTLSKMSRTPTQPSDHEDLGDSIPSDVSDPSDSVIINNSETSQAETNVTELSGYEDSMIENNKKGSKIPQSPKKSSKLPMFNKEKDSKIPVEDSPMSKRQAAPRKPPAKGSQLQKPKIHYKGNSSVDSGNISNNNNSMDSSVNHTGDNDDIIIITDGLDSSTNDSSQINDSHVSQNSDMPTSPKNLSKLPPKSPTPKSKASVSRIPKVFGSPKNDKIDNNRKASNTSQDSSGISQDASKHKPDRPEKPPGVPKGKSPTRKTSASPSRIPRGASPRKSSDSPSRIQSFKTFHGPQNNSKIQAPKSSQEHQKPERGRSSIPVVRPSRPLPPGSPSVKVSRSHDDGEIDV